MKLPTKTIASIFVLLVIVALFAYYISKHIQDFKSLTLVNPALLIALIAIFLFTYYLISIVTKNLIYPLGVYLKNSEAFALSVVTGFYNVITPAHGGMAVRAVYLKKKHNFTYTSFLSSLAGMYVITFLIASLIGIISSLVIYFYSGVFSKIIFAIFLTIFFSLLITMLFSPKIPLSKNNFLNRFIQVINGWHLIKNNKRAIIIVSLVSILQTIIGAFMLSLQFRVFGINVNFIKCLFLTSIGSLSILISITPAGLGINEAVAVFSALTIGITPTQSLSVALLGRVIQMLVLFALGPIFSAILIKHNPNNNEN